MTRCQTQPPGRGGACKYPTDLIKSLDIGYRVGAGSLADRRLIDQYHGTQGPMTLDLLVPSDYHTASRTVGSHAFKPGMDYPGYQGAFSAAAHSADTGETLQRYLDIDFFQVVKVRALNPQNSA